MLSEIEQSSPSLSPKNKDKYLLKASLDGRNGHDCEIVYPTCEALGQGSGRIPLPKLISPEHVSAIVHGNNPNISVVKLVAQADNHL
jgi:hypothetical protein